MAHRTARPFGWLGLAALLVARPAAAEIVIRDPGGRLLHLREAAGAWSVTDADGQLVPGVSASSDATEHELLLSVTVQSGREVGPYRLLRGAAELGGRRLRVQTNGRVLRLVMIAPPALFEEPPTHLADYGVPIVASVEGIAPDLLGRLSATAAILRDGTELCAMPLDHHGFGFFRGRFMNRGATPCGDALLEQGGGAYVVAVTVRGPELERVDRRAVFVPQPTARAALREVVGDIPVAMRANTVPPGALHHRGRFYASANIRGLEKLDPATITVGVDVYKNNLLAFSLSRPPGLVALGAGNYGVELQGEATAETGRYSLVFNLHGRTRRGGFAYETSARLFEFAVRSVEPQLSASVYFALGAAEVDAAVNAAREVTLTELRATVIGAAKRGSCRLELLGYASRDAAGARAEQLDLELSQRRAEAVRRWLSEGGAVPPGAFVDVRGLGQYWEAESESETTRAKNRRTMINVYCE